MRITCRRSSILAFVVAALPVFGADVSSNARQIFDKQLGAVEHEVMAVVETMPANKFGFVPREGAFPLCDRWSPSSAHRILLE